MENVSLTDTTSVGLPLWVQAASLVITLVLAGLRLVEFFRRGTLEIRLTRDSFFRLSDRGETLFVHSVLLARDGPVLIQDVAVTLRRIASKKPQKTTEKKFALQIIDHGEKIKGSQFRAEHHFYGLRRVSLARPTASPGQPGSLSE